ncbi:MAG: potassium channel family protein [Acidimicrobiia bacterium]
MYFTFRTLRAMWAQQSTRGLFLATAFILAAGTFFYRLVEDLGWVDAWYFAVVTLTTVGYGDISPETTAGKLFTSFYLLVGVGLIVAFGSNLITVAGEQRRSRQLERRGNQPE